VGLELDTSLASRSLRAEELVLDGQLDPPLLCKAEAFNVVLWDVTKPGFPRRIWEASLASEPRNRRHFLPVSFELAPLKRYRLLCRVSELRPSPFAGPSFDEPLFTNGGLSFHDPDPCSGAAVDGTLLDPSAAYLALRFRAPSELGATGADAASPAGSTALR